MRYFRKFAVNLVFTKNTKKLIRQGLSVFLEKIQKQDRWFATKC